MLNKSKTQAPSENLHLYSKDKQISMNPPDAQIFQDAHSLKLRVCMCIYILSGTEDT